MNGGIPLKLITINH